MLKRRTSPNPSRISIDLGGYHTRIFSEADGLILDEPSVGLLDMDHQHAGARAVNHYGIVAEERFADAPAGKRLIRPLQADYTNNVGHCPRMLSYFLLHAKHERLIGKSPIILLALPSDITELQTDQLRHACFTSGSSRVHLVDADIAAALGAGLPIEQPTPSILLDLGARGARLCTYMNDEVTSAVNIPCGGDLLTDELTKGIREQFGVQVSPITAQEAKHQVGSAIQPTDQQRLRNSCQVQGLVIKENFDSQFSLTTDEAFDILKPTLQHAADMLQQAINRFPVAYRDALQQNGIFICGGGTQLAHIDQLVEQATGLSVEVASRPLSTTARGGGMMLERIHGALKTAESA